MHPFFVRVFAAGRLEVYPTGPLLVTFDAALAALQQLPQMFAEPDGSFVWSSPPDVVPRWQVDGNLVDGGETLFYCELKGTCPPEELDQLLACLSTGATTLAFEAVEHGVVLNEAEFRRSVNMPLDT